MINIGPIAGPAGRGQPLNFYLRRGTLRFPRGGVFVELSALNVSPSTAGLLSTSSPSSISSSSDERGGSNHQHNDYRNTVPGDWAVASPYSNMDPRRPMTNPNMGSYAGDRRVDRQIRKRPSVARCTINTSLRGLSRKQRMTYQEKKTTRKGKFVIPRQSLAAPMNASNSVYWIAYRCQWRPARLPSLRVRISNISGMGHFHRYIRRYVN